MERGKEKVVMERRMEKVVMGCMPQDNHEGESIFLRELGRYHDYTHTDTVCTSVVSLMYCSLFLFIPHTAGKEILAIACCLVSYRQNTELLLASGFLFYNNY